MDLLAHPVHVLLLLALLLAVAPWLGHSGKLSRHPCSSLRHRLLDCRHAGLVTVPPASGGWHLATLDFTDNSISTFGKQTWRDYQWTETLILKDNDLQAVKCHSLEGLFLLEHLDLSGNKIKLIEERAFEPLPFLQHLNLSGNHLRQIHSGAFQAWHGMQFLQELILSHNPLSVIADTAFFKLPSVNYLDLSATQVSPRMLLKFLQTTVHLEILKLPNDMFCCLCKEHGTTKTPCRTIRFLCENLCSTNTPQCAHTGSLAQTQGDIMEEVQSGKLKTSTVLTVKSKEPLLGDHGTTTFAVALRQTSTNGDLSSKSDSRANSYSSKHRSRQESKTIEDLTVMLHSIRNIGWTRDVDLRKLYFLAQLLAIELKNKLCAQRIRTVKSIISQQPPPARQRLHEIPSLKEKTATGWEKNQHNSGLNWQVLNPTDNNAAFRHQVTKEAPLQRHQYIQIHKLKPRDTRDQAGYNPLFYEALGNVKTVEEPTPRENKAEHGLNRHEDFLSDPLVNSHIAARNVGKNTAEKEQLEKGLRLPYKSGSFNSPDHKLVPEEVIEAVVDDDLRSLVPDEALRTSIAHMARVLMSNCSLPEFQLACAKMISKTRLLVKLLSESQENLALVDQCLLQRNIFNGMAWDTGKEPTGEQKAKHIRSILIAILVSVSVSIVIMMYFIHVCCCQHAIDAFQPQSTVKSCLRRFFAKLQWRGSLNKFNNAVCEELARAGNTCQGCLSASTTRCVSALQIPGTFQGSSRSRRKELPFFTTNIISVTGEDCSLTRHDGTIQGGTEEVENNSGKQQQ